MRCDVVMEDVICMYDWFVVERSDGGCHKTMAKVVATISGVD